MLKYDPSGVDGTDVNIVEMWINENSNLTKQLKMVTMDVGDCTGTVTVRVSSFDDPRDATLTVEKPTETKTVAFDGTAGNVLQHRNIMARFMGMRGKFFRIRIEACGVAGNKFQLARVAAEVQYDEAPSHLNEPSSSMGTNPS